MKIKSKMILGSTLLAALPVIIASIVLDVIAVDTSSAALEGQVRNQLVALRESKKTQVEDYFKTIYSQLLNMASSPSIQYSTRAFGEQYDAIQAGLDDATVASMKAKVRDYYINEYAAEYKNQNAGHSVDAERLLNGLSNEGIYFQYQWIANNSHPLGSKNGLVSSGDNSRYDDIHKNNHPFFNDFITRFGYYDLFIADVHGDVVYSVYKELDFATNLKEGVYAASGIGRAYAKAMQSSEGSVSTDDFAPYTPSYDGPASFVATPVFENGERLGVLSCKCPSPPLMPS